MALEIPARLLQEWSHKQADQIRKLLELTYEQAVADSGGGTTLKYYEEEGTLPDSGTILSDSEIVASVASESSDMVDSSTSVLLGGANNTIDTGSASAINGGTGNEIAGSSTSTIHGGVNNEITDSNNCAILGGTGNTVDSATNTTILGGNNNTATGSGVVAAGSNAQASRPWGLTVGGGASTNAEAQIAQAIILSGGTSTSDTTPANIYFSSTEGITLLPNSILSFTAIVNAVRVSDQEAYSFFLIGCAKRVGTGNVELIFDDQLGSGGDAPLISTSVDLVADTDRVFVRVTAPAAVPFSWTATVVMNEQQLG